MYSVAEIIRTIKEQYMSAGHYGIDLLFIWLFLLIALSEKKNRKIKNVTTYLYMFLFVGLCPISAYYIMGEHTGRESFFEFFLSFPVLVIILLSIEMVYSRIETVSKRIMLCVGLLLIAFAYVFPRFDNSWLSMRFNHLGIDGDVIKIVKELDERESGAVLATSSFSKEAKQYPSKLIYEEGTAELEANPGRTVKEVFCDLAENDFIEYIVLDELNDDEPFMEENGFDLIREEGEFSVYYKEAPSCKITEYASASGNQAMFYTIEDKHDHLIIIDGGWTSDAEQVWKVIEEHNKIVDAWIITHPDPDHIGAFNEIMSSEKRLDIKIGKIYVPDVNYEIFSKEANWWDGLKEYEQFMELSKDWDNVVEVKAGDSVEHFNLTFDFYNSYSNRVEGADAINDGSLMFEVHGEKESMLFCADVGIRMSEKLIEQWGDKLKADYIQMGHHGNGGLNEAFYRLVAPRVAISDAPEWLFHPAEGTPYDSVQKTAIMESMGAQVLYYATAPNIIRLK